MYLRVARLEDEDVLREWLQNREDCLLVTNKYPFRTEDYLNWLESVDQHCYFLKTDEHQLVG
ncbi:MAG TPA: hypothetical protein VEV44_13815 [Pseudoneobacillus sp.]|nr:hypothetical protein [Pseudoneobacillus sp.]